MDVIGIKLANPQLCRTLHLKGLAVRWVSFCPGQTDGPLSSNGIEIRWPPAWATETVTPQDDTLLCIRKDNGAERLERSCRSDYTQGAALTPIQYEVLSPHFCPFRSNE